jgi:uncharacterized protein YdaU (DUF1376 family)
MGAPLKWFPFYIDDWDTDEKVRRLSFEERGVFLAMLCWQWREGSLPTSHRDVSVTLRARVGVVTKLFRLFFVVEEVDGERAVNRRMEQVRGQQVDRLEHDRTKAAAYRERMRVRAGDVTAESPHRGRSRIRSEIEKSLGVNTPGKVDGQGGEPE